MYSIVLMMAATTSPDAASFGGLFRGCHGCYGSCHGCYGACYGYGGCCGGCYGGGWGGCHGGLFHGHKAASCYGSCYGYGYGGCSCYGSGYGYGGCCSSSLWQGYGSCYGYGIYGGASLYASPPGGCYGYGMPQYVPQGAYTPPPGTVPPKVEPIPAPKEKSTSLNPSATRAAVTVKLPADARLFAEGHLTTLNSAERNFLSPELQPGRDYRYTLKVEYDRNGQTVSEARDVIVKAGERTTVEFKDQAVANRPAPRDAYVSASK